MYPLSLFVALAPNFLILLSICCLMALNILTKSKYSFFLSRLKDNWNFDFIDLCGV